jgi:hypothetical protein
MTIGTLRPLTHKYGRRFYIFMENETDLKEFRVLIVEPEKPPYVAEIENNLRFLQEMVGGNIQYVGLDRDTFFYCNEEGKLLGLQGNRKLDNGDIVTGTFS